MQYTLHERDVRSAGYAQGMARGSAEPIRAMISRFFRAAFRIEYILLFIALFTLSSTLLLKVRVSRKFDTLDLALSNTKNNIDGEGIV